ncbi:hypothetical protein M9H77_10643 [Catharanthus roseus]|uniref:Uncharacterized protein n=1 Tax=Catharanthus roseus TaxID=4058 RepID=A0ACC0BC80_CATRO|nr:hypothetical protein M9H77_10643 [Catharanthus roseus]
MSVSKQSNKLLSSHIVVAANDDLLIEILIRLPIKSLLRFKSVSKHWHSLIATNPHFYRRKSQQALCKQISGLLVRRLTPFYYQIYDFISLDHHESQQSVTAPFKKLKFVQDQFGLKILQSCNGLLLCRSFSVRDGNCNYYIFNPSTTQFTTLPPPIYRDFIYTDGFHSIYDVNLAFDPRKSPHYKAICTYVSNKLVDGFEIEVYSSETGLWNHIDQPFSHRPLSEGVDFQISSYDFQTGVYWNGAINWMGGYYYLFYFNFDEERFVTVPIMPVIPNDWEDRRKYFGESNDHLHMIISNGNRVTNFNVYEMDKEYSGWFIKYRIDLDIETVLKAIPESHDLDIGLDPLDYYRFLVLDVIITGPEKEEEEESYLVLSIPGNVVRYNIKDKSFKKLFQFSPVDQGFDGHFPMFEWSNCFKFIPSLMPV